jgi:hypothetical protein
MIDVVGDRIEPVPNGESDEGRRVRSARERARDLRSGRWERATDEQRVERDWKLSG